MIRSFTSRFGIIVVITACATVCFASEPIDANWYSYSDNFNSIENAENDSFYHSIFWPQGASPPSEPYLYHSDSGQLGFGDLKGLSSSQIVYRFPFQQEKNVKTISGELKVDLYPDENYGSRQELLYSLSTDGIIWSTAKDLKKSGTNIIELESVRGICYIKFSGMGVLIDNLEVVLNTLTVDYFVEPDDVIQEVIDNAIAKSGPNDKIQIEVASGTYCGDIDFKGRAITLYSKNGPEYTVIDCENRQRGFYFHQNEDSNSVVRGFTIQNGMKTDSSEFGAGIYCESSNPSIIDCVIQNCSAKYGAGIGLFSSSPYIADCVIQNCSSDQSGGYGAGIALLGSDPVIVNTKIINNTVSDNSLGAGVYCSQGEVLLANCEIRENKSTSGNLKGGGVYAEGTYTNIEFKNCIIADNTAQSGAGIYTDSIDVYNADLSQGATACLVLLTNCTIADNNGGGVYSVNSKTYIRNSIIWGNSSQNVVTEDSVYFSILYSDVEGLSTLSTDVGYGNINVDPLFSPVADDYHLKSHVGRYNPLTQTWVVDDVNSPCIDAGAQSDSVGPEPYPNGKRVNMGAYGGTQEASKNYSPAILHVSKNGNNTTGLSKEAAFLTIQKAVYAAHEGDIIMIWPGIYTEDVKLLGTIRKLTIQSADEAAEIRALKSTGYAFSFYGSQDSGYVLKNLIITNSYTAILCYSASPILTNLTIANNTFGIEGYEGAGPTIENCIFWNNTVDLTSADKDLRDEVEYSRLNGTLRQIDKENGNIDDNPYFVNSNASNGDYHLLSYSPCIDAGNPKMYPGREPKDDKARINMGAYGGTPFASKSSQ